MPHGTLNNKYVQNMCQWLRKHGYAPKYDHAGIYCIKLNDQIVYIGKSHNMLKRVAQHYVGIQAGTEPKYRILDALSAKTHAITFDVMYDAKEWQQDAITEEIGQKEGELIRQYLPILNTQIPKEEDWHKFEVHKIDEQEILNQFS